MDPPRCHRLCDLFGTCSAFCVCLLLLLLFLRLLLLLRLLQRLFSGPLCGGAVPYGSEKSSRLLPEGCASSCDDVEDFIVFFAFRFTFQDFARKLTSLLGRVPRLWTRLIALGPAPARLSRLPSSRSLFFWGDCSPERVRAISTARLCALPRLHLQPINVVVFNGPCVEILSWGGLRA